VTGQRRRPSAPIALGYGPGIDHPREGRRQRRSELTCDQLLDAARRIFETVGYEAATVGAITRAADTAHGTFYLYFQNKRDVFSRVVNDACREMYEAGQLAWDGADPFETLRGGILRFLEVFSAHRGLWRALIQGALSDPEIERMWADVRRPFIERSERMLDLLHQPPGGRGDDGPSANAVAANALSAMVEWVAFTHLALDQPAVPGLGLDELADGLARLWVRAVAAEELAWARN
jgi:AcrR family transcriptional regulator